ncbi:uncharacterized protein LOC143274817 [Babylonia areolata]|uniref:uncharacterized protein LOC143274817 n=1 Tax=Babylonia areolata TaxID=304850 RepID=UPI003FD3E4C1
MSSLAFVTHPSVRIKGSENVYSPVQCVDDLCPIGAPHMHCPFCVKTESYTDPVILKAHYRVKHVDKGIEFAGLKILRCCEHCDIVGVIKGEKKFKGAHWHCYRCRNGFNRRDEAIKHYKTHFRNPQTTFQISITQDLNSPVPYQQTQDPPRTTTPQSTLHTTQPDSTEIIHPALTQAVSCIASPGGATTDQDIGGSTVALTNGKIHDGAVHVSIEAACNSVDVTEEDEQAIIVIQEEQLEPSDLDPAFSTHIVNNEVSVVSSDKENRDKGGGGLAERVRLLEQDKALLNKEIHRLRKQVEKLEETVRACRKREEELRGRLGNATERGMAEVLAKMEADHRSLLRQQLDFLQQVVSASRSPSTTSTVLQLTDHNGQEIQVVSAASLEAFLASTVNASSGGGGDGVQTSLPTTTIIQAGDLALEQISGAGGGGGNTTTVIASSEVPGTSSTTAPPPRLQLRHVCAQRQDGEGRAGGGGGRGGGDEEGGGRGWRGRHSDCQGRGTRRGRRRRTAQQET